MALSGWLLSTANLSHFCDYIFFRFCKYVLIFPLSILAFTSWNTPFPATVLSIYSTDISSTDSNLAAVITELQARIKELEGQETTAQTAVTNCSNELTSVTTQLNNVDSESLAQRQVNAYYTEMKEYELKWQNGE